MFPSVRHRPSHAQVHKFMRNFMHRIPTTTIARKILTTDFQGIVGGSYFNVSTRYHRLFLNLHFCLLLRRCGKWRLETGDWRSGKADRLHSFNSYMGPEGNALHFNALVSCSLTYISPKPYEITTLPSHSCFR